MRCWRMDTKAKRITAGGRLESPPVLEISGAITTPESGLTWAGRSDYRPGQAFMSALYAALGARLDAGVDKTLRIFTTGCPTKLRLVVYRPRYRCPGEMARDSGARQSHS